MMRDDITEFLAAFLDLPCFYQYVLRLSLDASEWLVDHDTGVGERAAFPRCPGAEEDAAHRRGHARADGGDIGRHELYGVIDSKTRADTSAG